MEKATQSSATKSGDVSRSLAPNDLAISVATSIDEVIDARQLVYNSYRQIDIIDENPFGIHTTPLALSPATAVISGKKDAEIVSTLTIIHDTGTLPLDCVYKSELDRIRNQGRHIVEVGLLADRRSSLTRSINAMVGMMHYVYYQAFHGKSVVLCGVHPHHAGFYKKMLGFSAIGRETTYPTVKDHPVVLLAVDLMEWLKRDRMPKRFVEYSRNPLPTTLFDDRIRLTPDAIAGTDIESFTQWTQLPNQLQGTY